LPKVKGAGILRRLVLSGLLCGLLPGPAAAEKLDINTATPAELAALPYIGPSRARAIIACRDAGGPFKELLELRTCAGIGPDTLKIMLAAQESSGQPQEPLAPLPEKRQAGNPGSAKTAPGDLAVLADADYFPVLLDKIRGAVAHIDLTMFVFKTGKSPRNRPGMVAAALISAAERGVVVRVFLEKSGYDDTLNNTNEQTGRQLAGHGIEVIFDSPNTTTHSKLVVIDGRYSFVGSHNLTHAALKNNHEVSLLVDDRSLARKLSAYMEGLVPLPPR
jgi:competence ComEA-like helix-hairpin-helix protein